MKPSNTFTSDQTLGEILKQARESLGISLENISGQTKINQETIEAFENDLFDHLPAIPYLKAFLITLCKKYKLDPDNLIKKLNTQLGLPKEEITQPVSLKSESHSSPVKNPVPILVFTVVGTLLLFALLKYQNNNQVQLEEDTLINNVITDTTLVEPQDTTTDSIPLDTLKLAPTQDALLSTSDSILISNLEKPVKPSLNQVKSTSAFLILNCVKDSVWVNVKRNGKKELNKKMTLGTSWTLSQSDTITITSGVLQAIEFNLNGKSYVPEKKIFRIIQGKFQEF